MKNCGGMRVFECEIKQIFTPLGILPLQALRKRPKNVSTAKGYELNISPQSFKK